MKLSMESTLEVNKMLSQYVLLCDLIDEAEVTRNLNSFCAKVMKDEKGDFVTQAELHILWHMHIDYCWSRGLNPVILAPWGHGKTVQVVIVYPLFWFGTHSGERIKIVCNSDDNAKARVTTVSRYIETDPEYRRFFPNVMKDENESWTKHEIFIRRPAGVMSVDPSLQAKGIFSTGIGGRADMLLFDDVVDRRNAIEQPELRKKLPSTYQDVWMSRLEPHGKIIYIGTPWHKEDNTHMIVSDKSYCSLKQAISEDFGRIKTTVINCPDDEHPAYKMYKKAKDLVGDYVNVPLWHQKWSKEVLMKKCGTSDISKRSFNFGFRLEPLTSSDLLFPSFMSCIRYGVHPNEIVGKNWFFYTGVDLSTNRRKGNVLFTLGFNPTVNLKVPVDIRHGAWTSPEVADQLADVDRLWSPEVIMVESNAMQTALAEWIQNCSSKYLFWDRIQSYQTQGDVKRTETGLPGLETEFSNKSWQILVEARHDIDCDCAFCSWISEMNSYPFSQSTDHIMACWFAREACKVGTGEEFYDNWQDPNEAGMFAVPSIDIIGRVV